MGSTSMTNKQSLRGFTLIELSLVMAIIIVLVLVLVPAISKVRNSAKMTAATAQMKNIATACETYHSLFNDYPGVFSEDDYINSPTVSSSQAMYISLNRRFYTPTNPPPAGVTTIPVTLGSNNIGVDSDGSRNPKNYSAYVNTDTYNAFLPGKPSEVSDNASLVGQVPVPCYIDSGAFKSEALPILYYRLANKWDSDKAAMAVPPKGYAKDLVAQSYTAANTACFYTESNVAIPSAVNFNFATSPNALRNLVTKTSGTTSVPVGGFVLISAGVDRTFGTGDDIVLAGGE